MENNIDTAFDIEPNYFDVSDDEENNIQAKIDKAIERWESIITADIPDVGNVDDLLITFFLNTNLEADDPMLAGTKIIDQRSIEPQTNPANLLPWRARITILSQEIKAMILSMAVRATILFREGLATTDSCLTSILLSIAM